MIKNIFKVTPPPESVDISGFAENKDRHPEQSEGSMACHCEAQTTTSCHPELVSGSRMQASKKSNVGCVV